jgi:tetratricopeptide (TPR) repeat protein
VTTLFGRRKAIRSETYRRITALTDLGNELAKAGDHPSAHTKFVEALDLVPEPKMDWEATTWIVAAIGDGWFLRRNFEKARDAFMDAVRCPGGLGNVFIHLRLGEIQYELGDMKRAADELTRAYMAGGREVFDGEDPKYFALLERVLKPPLGKDQL